MTAPNPDGTAISAPPMSDPGLPRLVISCELSAYLRETRWKGMEGGGRRWKAVEGGLSAYGHVAFGETSEPKSESPPQAAWPSWLQGDGIRRRKAE